MGTIRDGGTRLQREIPSSGGRAFPWQCWHCHAVRTSENRLFGLSVSAGHHHKELASLLILADSLLILLL